MVGNPGTGGDAGVSAGGGGHGASGRLVCCAALREDPQQFAPCRSSGRGGDEGAMEASRLSSVGKALRLQEQERHRPTDCTVGTALITQPRPEHWRALASIGAGGSEACETGRDGSAPAQLD